MATATVVAKKWGNSIGVIIPKEIVEKEGIAAEQMVRIEVRPAKTPFGELFGKYKTGHSVQEIKDKLREELWGKEL